MKVFIEQLTFDTIIGILPFERETKQRVVIDLSFDYQYDDEKKDFVDYSHVSRDIENMMNEKKFELIEEALLFIRSELTKKYPISNLDLKIQKPDILNNCRVSVSLH
jgi:dihydroneopterin aldolase